MEEQTNTRVVQDPEPERYYDWMLWKLRQNKVYGDSNLMEEQSREETWKRTVADMQKEVHELQMMVVRLQKQINEMQQPDNNETNDSSYGIGYRQRYHT